ncbi:MAG TPA: TIGR03862 family flavoprotein [Alphaproteobacteria bacterium]|nr:TIGR03862 family flavoprotein [Micavibrio sp.]HQX27396.1 TIGR03862 family flavoprotein [Alphaproteobacteria bacterium]
MASPHIIIIGAGPAGLFAAETLAQAGHKVVVYDRKPSVGRKFLMAGRGGLNLTHSEPLEKFIARYGAAGPHLEPLIRAFTPNDLRKWADELGQETFIGSSGRVFPKSMKASPLLRAWLARLESLGVEFHLREEWQGWDNNGDLIFTSGKVKPTATLLALGGASWPSLGSDGGWYEILKDKKIPLSDFQPANCGFNVEWSDIFSDKFAGTPLKSISITHNGKTIPGEIMIGKKGVEGGLIYSFSRDLRDSSDKIISIDLRPGLTQNQILEKFKTPRARNSFSTYMQKTLSLPPVSISLLREVCRDVSNLNNHELAALIKNIPLTISAPFPITRAISTAGGIQFSALDENFMLKNLPGVFVAGEMLDWEAPTGGYLLQGCFATALHAAHGILNQKQGL